MLIMAAIIVQGVYNIACQHCDKWQQWTAAPYAFVQVMRGNSSYTSWYFVERAEIGDVNVNVTISLSSSILNTHAPGSVSLPENRGGLFSRVIGASGFQLINVNNVPLQLSGWSTDTKLIGRKALQSSLTRHYSYQGIREAHKVCCLTS